MDRGADEFAGVGGVERHSGWGPLAAFADSHDMGSDPQGRFQGVGEAVYLVAAIVMDWKIDDAGIQALGRIIDRRDGQPAVAAIKQITEPYRERG